MTLPLNQRERDLLRYCRGELHVAGLVTDDEYVEMLGWGSAKAGGGSQAARRLEDYDELRADNEKMRTALELTLLEHHEGDGEFNDRIKKALE